LLIANNSRWLRKIETRKTAKEAWAKVRQVIKGKGNWTDDQVDGLTAQTFSDH